MREDSKAMYRAYRIEPLRQYGSVHRGKGRVDMATLTCLPQIQLMLPFDPLPRLAADGSFLSNGR